MLSEDIQDLSDLENSELEIEPLTVFAKKRHIAPAAQPRAHLHGVKKFFRSAVRVFPAVHEGNLVDLLFNQRKPERHVFFLHPTQALGFE